MKKIRQVFNCTFLAVFVLLNLLLAPTGTRAQALITAGTYSQDFSTLANTGTSSTLPLGWLFLETGTGANSTYTAGTGSSATGDSYSFGTGTNTDRALGGLLSGSLVPTIGAFFQNNSGNAISSLTITYTGEEWRLGATGRTDQLTFEYSTNATSLSTGTWIGVSGLNFTTPNIVGPGPALDGNLAANRTTINATITGLNIANGANFYIRWSDVNITGSDDGLGIDDFSLTFTNAAVLPSIISVNPTSACVGSGASVIINGTNLSGITGVSFNGTPATFTGTATQISTNLPAGATTGFITITDGTNSANSPTVFTVNQLPLATTVSGSGTFCGNTTITASGGAGGTIYFQGTTSGGIFTGSPTNSFLVLSSNTYYFRSQSAAGCWGPEGSATVIINSAATPVTIFTESIGNVAATTTIASHESANGFDNDGYTMSGTGDIRNTTPSTGYTGSSGNANAFLTNNGSSTFQIAGINTTTFQELTIGFGIFKSTTASNGSELIVEVSADGITFTPLTFTALPTGGGTSIWYYRLATGTVPTTSNLRIRFRNSSTTPQFRIDDISLTGTNPSSTITAVGPASLCPGGTVTLTAPNASSFLWSTGQTTQTIVVNAPGPYSCQLTLPNSCVLTSNTINVGLLVAPAFTSCPGVVNAFASTASCDNIVNYTVTASGDSAPTFSYVLSGATIGSGSGTGSGATFNLGITQVIITATNSCGTAVCTTSVSMTDNMPPNASCSSIAIMLDSTGNATITPSQIDVGSTDNCGIASMTLSQSTFNCATVSAYGLPTDLFISEYIEGSSNNKCIEIFNGTGASVNLTAGGYQLKYYFNGSSSAGLTIPLTGIVSSGDVYVVCNSGAASIFLAQADLTNGSGWFNGDDAVVLVKNSGTTVLDIFGRIGEDPGTSWGVPPMLTENRTVRRNPDVTEGITINPFAGFPTFATEWSLWGLDDASGLGAHSITSNSGVAIVPVTLTVTDVNGLSSTCLAEVTVTESTPPTAICNSSITIALSSAGIANLTVAQVDGGSHDACGIANMFITPTSFPCSGGGFNNVSLFVTDVNGNTSDCATLVHVIDNLAPVTICQNITVVLDASGNATIAELQVDNGSADNCAITAYGLSETHFDCSDVGSGVIPTDLIISEYIEGSSNNKCIEIYNGTGAPIDMGAGGYQLHQYFNGSVTSTNINLTGIIYPGQVHVVCNSAATAGFLAQADQVTGSLSFNGDDAIALFNGSTEIDIFGRIGEDPGAAWVSGSLSTVDRTLRRNANILSGVTTNPAAGFPTLTTQWTGFPIDNNSDLGTHSITPTGNVVTLTTEDGSGNFATCNAVVTVVDNTPPVITCPATANITTSPGLCTSSASIGTATATDNCSAIVSGPVPAGPYAVGTTNVTWTATDPSGNMVTCTQQVIVTDNQNPVITCPATANINTNPGLCTSNASIGTATATDNCSATVSGPVPVGPYVVGTTTVTWTATDASGNIATCTQQVIVSDNQNPVITCPATANINTNPGLCTSSTSIGTATATDNCSAIVSGPVPAGPYAVGTTTVTWTATDASGNIATCTQQVIVSDNQNPMITCPATANIVTNPGLCTSSASIGTATATDNCSAIVSGPVPAGPYAVGTTTVTWTATDPSGNIATCTQQVVVTDNQNPVITCPATANIVTNPGLCTSNAAIGTATATDNCSATVSGPVPAGPYPVGTTTVTWTATDASGNIATCTQQVIVSDNQNPVITCPATANINTNPGLCTSSASIGTATATDNCSAIVSGPVPAGPYPVGTTTVTWTATDASGNIATCSQQVIVSDNQNPVITCPATATINADPGLCTSSAAIGTATVTDNCSATITGHVPSGPYPIGTTVVTWTATDASGNIVTCTQNVIVVDNQTPTITCPGNINVFNNTGVCGATVTYPAPTGSDNCTYTISQTNGLPSGSTFPVGTTVNTFKVLDGSGNNTTCSFTVLVTDNEIPTITNCPANFSSCNPVTWTPPTITDNCAGVVISSTAVPGSNFGPGTTTVTYTATDAYNNVSTCSFQVTRYEESVAATGITSDRDFNNICSGESINLTINGGTLGQGGVWKWYTGSCAGTPLPAFTGMTTINVSPTVTTTYFARAEGTCNNTACVSITVVVSTTGPPNGTLAILSMPPYGAPGVSGTITCTPVPGATFYRWSSINGHINAVWFPSAPGPVDTNVPSVNVLFNQTLSNYQIRVVAGNACGRTNNVSAHIRGTVPASTCLTGPVLACPNTTATYSVASCPIPGTNSYQWAVTGNATITSGQGTPTITVSFGAGFTTGTVCVNGITNFGLAGPQTCLTVSNSTAAPGAISGNNQPCQSGLENYNIAPVAGATSYLWTTNIVGATVSGTSTTGSVQFPSGSFSGNVCVQTISTCGTSVASCITVTSGVAGVPGPILGPVSGICGAIGNYALSTNNANSYNWILPPGVTFASPNGSNSVQLQFPAAPGSYLITVVSFYNCGSATSTITVNGAPGTPTVTPATICAGGTDETYIASAAGADSYNWVVSGAVYEQCTNPNCSNYYIIWDMPGGSFSVTASNACGVSAIPFSLSTNCRINEGQSMETKVYPNPTTGQLTVDFISYAGGNYNMTVTDLSGRMVLSEDVKAISGNNQQLLNLDNAIPGMYMLYIKDGNGIISVTKVTVE